MVVDVTVAAAIGALVVRALEEGGGVECSTSRRAVLQVDAWLLAPLLELSPATS